MIYHYLPKSLEREYETRDEEGLEEIRLRVGQPTEFIYRDARVERLPAVSGGEIQETLNYLSGYSLYLLEKEMKQGYFTAKGGHRIGISGRRTGHGITDINGLNIRVAHEQKGCSEGILRYLRREDSLYNTLLLAPPGVGKTTYLRDLIRLISTGDSAHDGMKVAVVDERSEIAACYRGVPQNDLGPRCDVLDDCPKVLGMQLMLRSMSPQVIAVDELGGEEDFRAIAQIMYSGCRILGTVHAAEVKELTGKPYLRDLLANGKIERLVLLQKQPDGSRGYQIFDKDFHQLCQSV